MSHRLKASLAAYAAVATAMSARPARNFLIITSSSIGVRNHHTSGTAADQASYTDLVHPAPEHRRAFDPARVMPISAHDCVHADDNQGSEDGRCVDASKTQ